MDDADSKSVETSKQTQRSSNEDTEPLRLEDPKSGEEPTSHRSKEVFLRKQSYTSPESTTMKEDESCTTETRENKEQIIVQRVELESNPFHDQESLSYLSVSLNGECRPEDTHNKCDEYIGSHTDISRLSGTSIDSELNSDSSEELLDEVLLKKKKKRDLVKSKRLEDPEEEFRRHFLKTFQDLPRISQISLDGEPKQNKSKDKHQEGERNTKEKPSTSNENIEKLTEKNNSLGKSPISTNTKNSATEINSKTHIAENSTEDLTKTGETTLHQNEDIQEEDDTNEKSSSFNKKNE